MAVVIGIHSSFSSTGNHLLRNGPVIFIFIGFLFTAFAHSQAVTVTECTSCSLSFDEDGPPVNRIIDGLTAQADYINLNDEVYYKLTTDI